MWIIAAVFSAVFAGITAILAKYGIRNTDSDLATAIRTFVVLVFSIFTVCMVGSQSSITRIGIKAWMYLVLSGGTTGASWICYFKALSIGDVNKVVSIDKSSTVLSVLFSIILFKETNNLAVKLIAIALIGAGTYFMIEKKFDSKEGKSKAKGAGWIIYAVMSAFFAAMTSIFAKIGMSGVESNLATAIRTVVVFVVAWGIVFARGKHKHLRYLDGEELIYISLSGLATGASWLCYYYAIQNGLVSVVVPIDKMSILVTVLFSGIFLKEKLSKKSAVGLCFMCLGTLATVVWA